MRKKILKDIGDCREEGGHFQEEADSKAAPSPCHLPEGLKDGGLSGEA